MTSAEQQRQQQHLDDDEQFMFEQRLLHDELGVAIRTGARIPSDSVSVSVEEERAATMAERERYPDKMPAFDRHGLE